MIFVDTSFFFPLLSAHDRDHPRVREVFEGLGNRRLPDLLLTTAQDERSGVPCDLEINSSAQPFYAPVHLQLKTGADLSYVMTPSDPVPGMYVAVRCDGYQPLVRKFDLRPNKDVELEPLLVIPENGQRP